MTARSDHSDLTTCDWTNEFCDSRDQGTIHCLTIPSRSKFTYSDNLKKLQPNSTHNCIAGLLVGCAAGLEALRAVCLQTFLGGFQLREATPFLLDQEIFGAADLLGRAQNALPIRNSFPE